MAARASLAQRAKTIEVVGLVVAAMGVLTEYLTGVPGFPTVPPGPIILAAAAVVVRFVRWRWSPGVGVLAAVFLSGGAVASGRTAQLLATPSVLGQWAGAVVQVVGLLTALVAGVVALTTLRRS